VPLRKVSWASPFSANAVYDPKPEIMGFLSGFGYGSFDFAPKVMLLLRHNENTRCLTV
jgi:hypothetical protein